MRVTAPDLCYQGHVLIRYLQHGSIVQGKKVIWLGAVQNISSDKISCIQKPYEKDCGVSAANNGISWEESTPVIAAKAASYGGFSYTRGNDNSAKEASCLFPF